jgi:mRNA interferase RelE/StbE
VTYEVVITGPARRALVRLPPGPASAVVELLAGALAENPHRLGKPLHLELAGLYSARRGEYRIVYSIDDEARRVTVRDVGHRRDVYR